MYITVSEVGIVFDNDEKLLISYLEVGKNI